MATRLFHTLAPVAILAKHLEIVRGRVDTLGPRRDEVGLHYCALHKGDRLYATYSLLTIAGESTSLSRILNASCSLL